MRGDVTLLCEVSRCFFCVCEVFSRASISGRCTAGYSSHDQRRCDWSPACKVLSLRTGGKGLTTLEAESRSWRFLNSRSKAVTPFEKEGGEERKKKHIREIRPFSAQDGQIINMQP